MSPTHDPTTHEDAREERFRLAKEFTRLCKRDEEERKEALGECYDDYRKDSMGDESNYPEEPKGEDE